VRVRRNRFLRVKRCDLGVQLLLWVCDYGLVVGFRSQSMATLKVRVRAATGGPTLRVQLPQPCTLQALKDAIAVQIGEPASSFHVSLNKKDSISGPSGVLLSAFGVINGDLLFYIPSTGGSVPVAHVPVSCLASHTLLGCSVRASSSSSELETFLPITPSRA
jgi:hypothetical protein